MTPYDRDASLLRSFSDFLWGAAAVFITLRIMVRRDDVSLYVGIFIALMWAFTKMFADGFQAIGNLIQWWRKKHARKDD